jgi:hypothetical protein
VPYSPDLGRLLTEGARYRDERAEYVIERHAAGEVRLPTGQVVGCDPLTDAHEASPFAVTAPAGTYPLHVRVAVLHRDPGGLRTAVTDEPTGANVTVVSSGWGDGLYPTFIGYAASGAVASFVTDFMVVPG